MSNPFILTFGREPINFIPRVYFLQEVKDDFYSETHPNQAYMIAGVRGTGKTVFLTKLAKEFDNNKNWIVVDLNPERDMLESFASQLYNNSRVKTMFAKAELNISFNGIGFSIGTEKPSNDIETVINKMVDHLSKKDINILITVDDATSNDYIKIFAHTYQGLIRKGYPVFLLMSGLYENIASIQKNKALTFLSRVPKLILKPLNMPAIRDSYQKIFELDNEHAAQMAKLTQGYAYAYQVLGYLMWKSESKEISNDLLSEYDQYLAEFVYDKIWEGLSEKEKNILISLSESKALELKANELSVYRDRLIKYGILFSKQRGSLSFALPRFKEYIKNKILFD